MAHVSTILSQMLLLFPRHIFDHIVDSHAWESPKARKFSYWSQLTAMTYAQLSGRKSLRDLVFSLGQQDGKLYHLGVNPVKRSTLAEANEKRPAIIFEKAYYQLFERLHNEMDCRRQDKYQLKIIDATTITLCASVFPWATFRSHTSGIKLHTVFLPEEALPQCVVLTEAKEHDLNVAKRLSFTAGDLLIFDRAYIDYQWLYELHCQGAWFVTRLKSNARFQTVKQRALDHPDILADEDILVSGGFPEPLRRISYRDPETGKKLVFVTNRMDLPAITVAELYRQRWQIELFFKWVKQNLKIKACYGTSENAVLIQIWTALIAYLLLIWIKLKSRLGWSILEITRFIQTRLMERCRLWDIIRPQQRSHPQLPLFNFYTG